MQPDFTLDVVDGISPILEQIVSKAKSSPELLDRVSELLNSGVCLVDAAPDGDGLTASGAGDLCVVCKPSDRLLELAQALGAGEFDVSRQHGGAP